jgi:hypothetical protein
MRRGWAVSTIQTILVNEKYLGRWTWNKTTFVKDPETGKRTPVARPKDNWVVNERPDLAIVDGDLWKRVQARLETVRTAYGARENQKRPRGQAPKVYSPHPLSGLIRREICGPRITIQTSQRKKNGVVHRYGRYRCSFHVTKGFESGRATTAATTCQASTNEPSSVGPAVPTVFWFVGALVRLHPRGTQHGRACLGNGTADAGSIGAVALAA